LKKYDERCSAMTWNEIRLMHPSAWVIIEAVEAYTRDDRRHLEQTAVIGVFGDDGDEAMQRYIQLHRAHPEREMYVVNTERLELDIEERKWTGVRMAPGASLFEMACPLLL
jgi:hypothetical protein